MKHIVEGYLNDITNVHNIMFNRLASYVKEHGTIIFNGVIHNENYDEDFPCDEWETDTGIISGSVIIFPIQLYIKDDVLMLKYKEQELDEGYEAITNARLDEMSWYEINEIVKLLLI